MRTYVVTGSSSGIGAAMCTLLVAQGHRVVGVDREGSDVIADLGTSGGRRSAVADIDALTGGVIDGVVTCAAIQRHAGHIDIVRTNYFGTVEVLLGLHPLLARGEDPRAVAVGSIGCVHPCSEAVIDACLALDEDAAVAASAGQEAVLYASTKRAISRWVRQRAPTPAWAGNGIALNVVAPAHVDTPMAPLDDPDVAARVRASTPMPFRGSATAAEVATVIAWLASGDNRIVTGQVLFADGGADAVLRGDDVWRSATVQELGPG